MDYAKLHARMPGSYERTLGDNELEVAFYGFTKKDLSDEGVEFLAAYAVWAGNATAVQKKIAPKLPSGDAQRAAFIARRYLVKSAPKQINVTEKEAKAALVQPPSAAAFAEIADLVRATLSDPFARFVISVRDQARAATLKTLRDHQKKKIDGFAILGGKHPSGRYIAFNTADALILVSSAQAKPIDAKYLQAAQAVGCKQAGAGIWVQEGKGSSRVFTISGSSDVDEFRAALAEMGVAGKVEAASEKQVSEKIAIVDPKKSDEVKRSKELDKELKKDAKKVKITATILSSRPNQGDDTADEAWQAAQAVMSRLLDKTLVNRARSVYSSSKAPDALEKVVTTGKFWIVLYADAVHVGQKKDAFVGIYLYRGASKPARSGNPNTFPLKSGWTPLVTPSHLLQELLGESGVM